MHARIIGLALAVGIVATAEAGPRTSVQELEQALGRINHPEPLQRLRAQWTLEALVAEGSVAPLLEKLAKHHALRIETVTAICQVLGELGVDKALPHFVELAKVGKQPEVKVAAATGLFRMQSKAGCDALAGLVEDSTVDPAIRQLSLVALAYQRDPRVLELSKPLRESTDVLTRRAAYRALGYSQNPAAIDPVSRGLLDRHPLVSSMAAWALAKLDDASYAPKLRKHVKRLRPGGIRFMLVDALARMGEQEAIREVLVRAGRPQDPRQYSALVTIAETREARGKPVLRQILAQSLKGRTTVDAGVLAAFTLGKLQDQDALEVLSRAASKAPVDIQRAAVRALGLLGNAQGEAALLKASYQRDLLVRFNALVSLAQLTGSKHPKKLRNATRDRDPIVRYGAAVALESSRDPKVARLIEPLTKDSIAFVRVAAVRALATLGGAPEAAVDDRDPELLDRAHALERQYVLAAKTNMTAQTPSQAQLQASLKGLEAALEQLTALATCGGTHPPKPSYAEELQRLSDEVADAERALQDASPSAAQLAVLGNWVKQAEVSYDLRRTRTRTEAERTQRLSGY